MKKLSHWTARRAGGRITINAVDAETGQPFKVVGVDQITGPGKDGGHPIAIDKNGDKYELV